ncbi:MAG TPA: hypothetical protein ENH00_02545 [Actinobacteria bacterium]|nr:hypothetical protein [Actinomycetota bacterium]
MTPTDPTLLDPSEFLTSRRLGAAIGALADPDPDSATSAAGLDEGERHAIRRALDRSTHPLVGVAHGILDQWDQLDDDDRTAGLLLFAQLTRSPERRRTAGQGLGR